ncbi:endo-1,4-beta-xylanase 1 [Oryza sativa Japonica Group]|uniref:Os03g0672900 protein n=2 Tax=Oryza sativa subsp. japonica TaxID=39947 RepID=Q0DPP8_ORYSJ|nr:uncharacterized protein LOC4333697 [Oryza sativa Japonica Group]KAB8092970.1 hypothetical protein EE612_019583 [Oryza sativa]AAP03380.1 putative xylan xylanohydrolase isoenzyme [Oryza sativa Japonica Group]AAR87197.1 putative xylan xylanohydrolase [Oryza sativa Japonica Group]ABF98138.1 Endo-1,4-beta-xylanase, putative, expressed [Oryza sativa Japonica Group]EAZ28099.1 hypothetical protein OsJ_12065 [Oryza sativa Japonica Group]|eukprot:NP_001050876.1 Os03g0672900 [Oryza sativa Japonica Group]
MAIGGDAGQVVGDGGAGAGDDNIILNPEFDSGLDNWSGSGCKIELHDSLDDGKVLAVSGKYFVAATGRTDTWNGVQQDVTSRLQRKLLYEVAATVRLSGAAATPSPCEVRATVAVQNTDGRQQYISVAKSPAVSDKEWVQLQGKFLLNGTVAKAAIYIEGPPAGVDLLLDSLVVKHAQKATPAPAPDFKNLEYGANILQNSDLDDGVNGWFGLGSCALSVHGGAPRVLPPMARQSLSPLDGDDGDGDEPLNGKHIHVTNRAQTWMGPAQVITDRVTPYATYQVSAWVRVGGQQAAGKPQNINVAVAVDSQWLNGGQVMALDERWYEIGGSFRVESSSTPPSRVMLYVQGPDPGVDLMVAGLRVFPVDRKARAKHLRKLTDKVRKRDVVVKVTAAAGGAAAADGVEVRVRQVSNSFPLGACIMRTNMDNEDYVDFFTKHFNWAVFGNELKWYWTEPEKGQLNYADADDLLKLCADHGMCVRGHCIFWEVDSAVQQWVKALPADELSAAVASRINGLLTRYKGKFRHYDVNNEMLHGSFYQDKLGAGARAAMFRAASELDPDALLFVNDYNVEGACVDVRATPEAYIAQVTGLQEQGAAVGGVGLQGHVTAPVGAVVRAALDRLAVLGLPLWFTELDVSSANEHVRADDLEAMLREAYAHPAVDGVVLWGFWELSMSRDDAHLVDAEGEVNEAGRRLLQLKREWLTRAHGRADGNGEFRFRGHHGAYHVDVVTPAGAKISQEFTVDKDDAPLVLNITV